MAAGFGRHELSPGICFKVAGEKMALAAQLLRLFVHIVHELVDEGNGYLLHLRFGVGDFTDENITGGVDTAFGNGIKHEDSLHELVKFNVVFDILRHFLPPFFINDFIVGNIENRIYIELG